MPDLSKSLQGKDLGHFRIIADLWNITLEAGDARTALPRLVELLVSPERVSVVVAALPTEARAALDDVLQNGWRMRWALFTRRHGALREMGPGRRDRERPHLSLASPAEVLYYRGLVGRAFFDSDTGPEEFAYIPDDLATLLPAPQRGRAAPLGRPASPLERSTILPAHDGILDAACTLLAALRLGFTGPDLDHLPAAWGPGAPTLAALRTLLTAAGLLDAQGIPLPEPARTFLEASRAEALNLLWRAWLTSETCNDLRLIPGLKFEGEWQNDPLRTRQALLDFLSTIPGWDDPDERTFWSLAAFIEAVKQRYPDFQRPAGNYDVWYIQDETGKFLRGLEHWDAVDGALIRYLITGPFHWLGILDLAHPQVAPQTDDQAVPPPTAFRRSAWAEPLLAGRPPEGLSPENEPVILRSDLHLSVPRLAPRSLRYQLARFCEWDGEKDGGHAYHLTPASLLRARQQGLTTNHLLNLLRRHARAIPPSLTKAIERWEREGAEITVQPLIVLRTATPDLLQTIRTSKLSRYLGDPLGPTTVIVKPGAIDKITAGLAEMGLLAEIVK